MTYRKRHTLIILILLISMLYSNSRVAFSRPQLVYRTPSSYFPDMGEGKVSLGFTSEILDFEVPSSSSSAFFNTKLNNWNLGFSYTALPDYRALNSINALEDNLGTQSIEGPLDEAPYEIGMHLQRRIYGYKSLYMDIGVHDILLKSINQEGLFDNASFFFVVSNNKKFNNYDMTINYGFGTGKIGSDPHNYNDTGGAAMSPFLSLLLNTPFFNKKMNLLFEYDGSGINVGTQFPITDVYMLRFGVSHLNKITEWANREKEGNEGLELDADAPAITIGFLMNIPDIGSDQDRVKKNILGIDDNQYGDFEPLVIIDSTKIVEQRKIIKNYSDSLSSYRYELQNIYNENALLRTEVGRLEDSTKTILLENQINQSKRNEAMRLFQDSYDRLVEEKYYESLDIINKVIELQPKLAIAYARRGTIYYYLGDLKAASMNWNLALKLDPEYYQVRDVLKSLREGSLEKIYKSSIDENNKD
ncbi:MAG: hypothetical protein CMG11_04795 [Candidatus Marinimicrobia bacterium]|nr:hypothetical protein [Candidatus Neomarinimicrobiota bacterium]|tara:strand:- start:4215 stop:5636 length:1422 start_codon:yes stop_codon:yes gene_type:complete